jgi:hypothetical protein
MLAQFNILLVEFPYLLGNLLDKGILVFFILLLSVFFLHFLPQFGQILKLCEIVAHGDHRNSTIGQCFNISLILVYDAGDAILIKVVQFF